MSAEHDKTTIARHKTAIKRQSFSLPVKCMLRDGLLDTDRTFFDYGCGHGQDLELLSDMSIEAAGWDHLDALVKQLPSVQEFIVIHNPVSKVMNFTKNCRRNGIIKV